MYTPEMLESMAKVEAHRARNLATRTPPYDSGGEGGPPEGLSSGL